MIAHKSSEVSIEVVNTANPHLMYGQQFDSQDELCSLLSKESLAALSELRTLCVSEVSEISEDDNVLLERLKTRLGIYM